MYSSVVIRLHESRNLIPGLVLRLTQAIGLGKTEQRVILVDDGSTDAHGSDRAVSQASCATLVGVSFPANRWPPDRADCRA